MKNAITNKEKIDWVYLEKCICRSSAPTVNLSGGGDPFYNWQKNIDFFNKVYQIASKYSKSMDAHTRIIPSDMDLLSKFRKIAVSIEMQDTNALRDLYQRYYIIKNIVQIRVVNVLNTETTIDDVKDFIKELKNIGIEQITFRQMFGNRKAYENFNSLKDKITTPGVLFLKDGEYHNYYFTTDNKVYPYFFGYTEEDRKEWMKKYENIEQSCG